MHVDFQIYVEKMSPKIAVFKKVFLLQKYKELMMQPAAEVFFCRDIKGILLFYFKMLYYLTEIFVFVQY